MGKPNEITRDLPPLSLRAAIRPGSVDEKARTAEVIWTTGVKVLRGFFDQFWEQLSLDPKHVRMERLNNGAPLLASHSQSLDSVLGVVESAKLEKGRGVATVRFARAEDDPEADVVFRKVRDGIIRNVSVGYRVYRFETVEDSTEKIPTRLATDWEPFEISAVPVGADAAAGFRELVPNPCLFPDSPQPHEESRAMAQPTNPTDTPAPAPAAAASPPDPVAGLVAAAREETARDRAAAEAQARAAAEQAVTAERARIDGINRICTRHLPGTLGVALAEKLVKANTSLDRAREIVLEELARSQEPIDGHVRVEAGDDAREKFIRGGVASILDRCGRTGLVAEAMKVERLKHLFAGTATDPGEFRGMRLLDLARHSLELRGVSTKRLQGEDLIKRALSYRADSGFNTTSDFAVLLETAVNKTFLGQYALVPVTWPNWCGRKSVQDFRTSSFYRPGTFGALDTLTEAGEIKHKNIPDGEKRTLTPATKANIVGITRRAMVNDDLGAFRDLAAGLGLAAALSIETDAFAMVTANSGLGINYDANPLFHSSRSNIGTSGAMSVTTLDGSRAIMAKQKDPAAANYLALRPRVWLGPVELGGLAKQIFASQSDPTDSKNAGVANRVLNLCSVIVDSPYLSAQSATRHYMLADPGLYPVFAVGFIDGNEAPRMESEQVFGYDGLQIKAILDYGTAVLDYRGAITCPGS